MKHYINQHTFLLDERTFPELEISRYIGLDDSGEELVFEKKIHDRVMNENLMMKYLRENPRIANKLASYSGSIIYVGRFRNEVGMSFTSRSSKELEGSNSYGILIEKCRDRYISELKGQIIAEKPVRANQITVDFAAEGAEATDIELQERAGSDRYIHVGLYRPVQFKQNADELTGTTGHAQRTSASDVKFHTFECPFGLTRKHKILVENAAEASMCYEAALRGELDWKALFGDLRKRGLIKGISAAEESRMIDEFNAQFIWMREQILQDSSLSGKTIVADSMLIADRSMGRSVYHPEFAPSPAHILARYINNPQLLYTSSENAVTRALEKADKEEAVRFSSINGQGEITIVVNGSDTIGGRIPGTKTVRSKKNIIQRDSQGRIRRDSFNNPIQKKQDVWEMEFKSDGEKEIDFKNFSARMDSAFKNLDPNVKVRFISGKGVGCDQMLAKYVASRGGNVYDWSYTRASTSNASGFENKDKDARFSVVRMSKFNSVYPVLVGRQESVTFNLSDTSDESEVHFSKKDGLTADGFMSFSVDEDSWNTKILERGSLAAASGKPFLHVINNLSEAEQLTELELTSEKTKYNILGEPSYQESLFGEVRQEWNLNDGSIQSHMPSGAIDIAIPFVANRYDVSVPVNNVPFNSVYSLYCALVMKNIGIEDHQAFRDLVQASEGMISTQQVFDRYTAHIKVSDEIKEKCMRNAVHMMTHASSRFADSLLNTGTSDIICVSSLGDPSLFTDINGKGENRFGIVMMAERSALYKELEISRAKDAEEARKVTAELARRQKRLASRAPGEKIATGFPRNHQEALEGVWLLGTAQPVSIALSEDEPSFVIWEEGYNQDILNREKASAAFTIDIEGNKISNDYVFLFPSNLIDVARRFPSTSDPGQRDLTGVVRVDPRTGESYNCAFGIAVKRNKDFYEHNNKFGKPCSFFLDNDGATVANSIYSANAEARYTALKYGLALCYSAYSNSNGDLKDSLSRVFEPKVWDYERTKEIFDRKTGKITQEGGVIIPKEYTVKVYNKASRTMEYNTEVVRKKSWVDNPHSALKNLAMIKRYEEMLKIGSKYPLTCFSLPRVDYDLASADEFMNDLNYMLNMANATALMLGKPLRFALNAEGRIDLGAGIPKEFQEMAERRINHYINVVQDENLIDGKIPVLKRIPIAKAFTNDRPLERDGSDIILRPNDLLVAFGRYNFHDILVGNRAPMHEMAFQDDEGNIFKITDPRFSSKFTQGEINKYLRYDSNDEIRWNIRSSDATKIPAFVQALKSYIARAKEIEIEYKLFSEVECLNGVDGLKDLNSAGYVHLLASNDENYELTDNHVISSRPNETMVEMDPDWVNVRGRQGREDDEIYAGKTVANDGFKGWVVYRYKLPDGTLSDWKTVDDLEFAKDIVLHSVNRVYRTDTRIIPSPKVIDATLKSLAVKDCGNILFNMEAKLPEVKVDDKVVVLPDVPQQETPTVREVNIHFGSGDNPQLSNFAIRPFDYHIGDEILHFESVEQGFQYMKSYYTQCSTKDVAEYRKAVLSITDGKELRDLGRSLPAFDVDLWDNNSPLIMKDLLKSSFQSAEARELLLGTGDAVITHRPDDSKWGVIFPMLLMEVRDTLNAELGKNELLDIVYTTSTGGYQKRTLENAQADDVDFTLAFAVDFNTYGEKATARAAGESLIAIDLPVKANGGLNLSLKSIQNVVTEIIDCLPEEYINNYECGLNIAGNGIYTLDKSGIKQDELDIFLSAVGQELVKKGVKISSVRSGGQTGVDEAGAVMGKVLGVPTTVHAPNNWAFRGKNGKDVTNDRNAFIGRFNSKDINKVAQAARNLIEPKIRKKSPLTQKM